jgi:ubiquinone/menaquinone biosynthesis C-methylase UbiE
MDEALAELHAPLLPILRHVLALAPLPRSGIALDLACGSGLKAPLLADALGPGVRLIGVDVDPAAIHTATHELKIEGRRWRIATPSSILYPLSSRTHPSFIVGDAQALPLREACCDAAFCIAALGLFADRLAALREMRRVLRRGSPVLFVAAAQIWAQVIPWPADMAARLAATYAQALGAGVDPVPAMPDLGGELAELLIGAGFAAPLVRAFRLSPWSVVRSPWPAATDHGLRTTDNWQMGELPLLPWAELRPLLEGRLAGTALARCDEVAAAADVELCELALVALAKVPFMR